MISKEIQQVGITKDGTNSANEVFAFARKLLTSSISTTTTNPFSTDELKGTWEFVQWLKSLKNPITISEPTDLWKFSTFITYMVDLRDMSVVIKDSVDADKANIQAKFITNITQAANYTLSALSGDCNDYARLYDATLYNMAKLYSINAERYSVYFTPHAKNKTGHVTYLYSLSPNKWHALNFYNDYKWNGDPWEVSYIWANGYEKGYTGYDVTIAQNQFDKTNRRIAKTFSKPIASDSIENLVNSKHVNPNFEPNVINHTQTEKWTEVQKNAYTLFGITAYKPQGSNGLIDLTKPDVKIYLIYAFVATVILGVLI